MVYNFSKNVTALNCTVRPLEGREWGNSVVCPFSGISKTNFIFSLSALQMSKVLSTNMVCKGQVHILYCLVLHKMYLDNVTGTEMVIFTP